MALNTRIPEEQIDARSFTCLTLRQTCFTEIPSMLK